jgi:hypothetical protein
MVHTQELHGFLFGLSQISVGQRNIRQVQNTIALATVGFFACQAGLPIIRKDTLAIMSRTVQAVSHFLRMLLRLTQPKSIVAEFHQFPIYEGLELKIV